MELESFNLENITKNSVIKIVDRSESHRTLRHNIGAKIKTKYGVICLTTQNISPMNINLIKYYSLENTKENIFVLLGALAYRSYRESYLTFVTNTRYQNYIFCYSVHDGVQIDADVTFICDEKSPKNVSEIYDKYVDKLAYSLEQALAMFKKYNIIVITQNGKSLTHYQEEYTYTYINQYRDIRFESECVFDLIKQIEDGKSFYHEPNKILHKCLQSHWIVLKMCHYALYLLDQECYVEIRNIILNLLLKICRENKNTYKIRKLCFGYRDYDKDFWNGYYFLKK